MKRFFGSLKAHCKFPIIIIMIIVIIIIMHLSVSMHIVCVLLCFYLSRCALCAFCVYLFRCALCVICVSIYFDVHCA